MANPITLNGRVSFGKGEFGRASLAGRVWQAPAKGDLPKETCQRRPAKVDRERVSPPEASVIVLEEDGVL